MRHEPEEESKTQITKAFQSMFLFYSENTLSKAKVCKELYYN